MSKNRHTIWLSDSVWGEVKSHYLKDDCTTQNEFVEKALKFYIGYLNSGEAGDFIPEILTKSIQEGIRPTVNRMASLFFKYAVEKNMMNRLLSLCDGMEYSEYRKLRDKCVKEVRETNGFISPKDKETIVPYEYLID